MTAERGVIGEFDANLLVLDDDRGSAEVDIHVVVVNINDPPTVPVIIKPINDTSFERETNVTFDVDFADPDIVHGQLLTVTWSSNLSGTFKQLTSDDEMSFTWDSLPVGEHKVTVSITDGEFTRSAWVKLSVIEPYTPPPPDDNEGEGGLLTGSIPMLALLIIILLVIVVAALYVSRDRGDGEQATTPPPTTDEQVTIDVHGSLEGGTGPPTYVEGYQMPSSDHGHDQMSVSSEPLVGQPLEQIAPIPGTLSEDPLPEVRSTDAEGTTSLSEDERLRKLERLEERLLDGAISEETYRELKAKYGG